MRGHNRMSRDFDDILATHGPTYVLDAPPGPVPATIAEDAHVDITAAFGRTAPLVVEIGPGNGEQLTAAAVAHPEWNILAVEAWHPGVARCVGNLARAGVTNVRLLEADAAQALPVVFGLEVVLEDADVRGGAGVGIDGTGRATGLRDAARPGSVNPRAAQVWTFFPDPWRKARHRKRRLVSDGFAATVAGILESGGVWRLATDWDDYAWQMRDVIEGSPWFTNPHAGQRPDAADPRGTHGGFAPRFDGRIRTHFEQRGTEAGRTVHDIVGVRA